MPTEPSGIFTDLAMFACFKATKLSQAAAANVCITPTKSASRASFADAFAKAFK